MSVKRAEKENPCKCPLRSLDSHVVAIRYFEAILKRSTIYVTAVTEEKGGHKFHSERGGFTGVCVWGGDCVIIL